MNKCELMYKDPQCQCGQNAGMLEQLHPKRITLKGIVHPKVKLLTTHSYAKSIYSVLQQMLVKILGADTASVIIHFHSRFSSPHTLIVNGD